MKYILLLTATATLLFSGCTIERKIEFVKAVGTEMGNIQKETARFRTTLVFLNLTEDEYEVKDVVLDFKIDGKDVGTIFDKNNKKIKPHSEFSIPLKYAYETKDIIGSNEEPEHVYLLEANGNLTCKDKLGNEFQIPVSVKESYDYKTNKEIRIEEKQTKKEERQERREERREEKEEQKEVIVTNE